MCGHRRRYRDGSPVLPNHGPQQARSQALLESADGSRAHRREQIQFVGEGTLPSGTSELVGENDLDGMVRREEARVRSGIVLGPRTPGACGRGAAPNPARGTSPLRPPAPFPFLAIVRNGPPPSRVRKPRKKRAPLTAAGRSEEFTMTRERGPQKVPPRRPLGLPLVGSRHALPVEDS
jgi:hypothetical protein